MRKVQATSFLSLLLLAIAPVAVAQLPQEDADNRIEKYENLTEVETESLTQEEQIEGDIEAMEAEEAAEDADYRAEETLQRSRANTVSPSDTFNYDVRRTEAFNLVSSAYRGQFEEQGINSYAVLISNYQTGELTAEKLIQAAIDAGELSPAAMEDDSYVNAVEVQLDALTQG